MVYILPHPSGKETNIMISIKKLFENFMLPGKIFGRRKKKLPGLPTLPNRKIVRSIDSMNSKLSNINNQIQR